MTQELVDRQLITELAQGEWARRDARQWDRLLDCYHPDARVVVTWFDGSAEEFVQRSRDPAHAGRGRTVHQLGPSLVELDGDRALVDTACAILIRRHVEGVACDVTAYCRHRSRVERLDGQWRLHSLVGVYYKNTLTPVVPGTAPKLDTDRLSRYRPSYDFQCYYREQQGEPVFSNRPGLDRPDLIEKLETADSAWLSGQNLPLGIA